MELEEFELLCQRHRRRRHRYRDAAVPRDDVGDGAMRETALLRNVRERHGESGKRNGTAIPNHNGARPRVSQLQVPCRVVRRDAHANDRERILIRRRIDAWIARAYAVVARFA